MNAYLHACRLVSNSTVVITVKCIRSLTFISAYSMFRFDPKVALEKLRGKRLMFVGDSLQRGQWQSFVCLVEFIIPADQKSMRRGRVHSTFRAKVQLRIVSFNKSSKILFGLVLDSPTA